MTVIRQSSDLGNSWHISGDGYQMGAEGKNVGEPLRR